LHTAEQFIEAQCRKWEIERKRAEAKPDHATFRTKDIGRRGSHGWMREAWTFHIQTNYRVKVLVIERLRNIGLTGEVAHPGAQRGDIEYRFGYYILGRIGRAKGRWVWGQFSPFIPHDDLMTLLEKARAEGTFLS
jgi:hypothetical protein